ncbi:MAG: molybdopterin molybdotransferase MoeA, partial [Planctomycetes bacterium]|nr:molybdopterin molybdotransferase MoeA [Planctomycetota bacterium]
RVLLEAGRVLSSADLSAAAGCGADPVFVAARPRVIVMSTGDEVVPWATEPEPHQVRDSNRLGSIAQLIAAGADVIDHLHVPDDPEALRAAVESALGRADLLVTIGGVSMGDKDHLPSTFEACGVAKLFHGVSVQPGKPVWAGHLGEKFVLGLPGNPVSSFVMLETLAVPLLQRMMGGQAQMRPYQAGILGAPARAKKRERFLPADLKINSLGQLVITPRPEQGSGDWTSLAGADALLHVSAGLTLAAGEMAECLTISGATHLGVSGEVPNESV